MLIGEFLLPSKSWQVSKNSWSNSHRRSVTYPNAHSMTSQMHIERENRSFTSEPSLVLFRVTIWVGRYCNTICFA